jgi:hypothetical protein
MMALVVALFAMAVGAIVIATVLMFAVSTALLSYRAYRIEKGTWQLSATQEGAVEWWATFLTRARWIVHPCVVAVVTLAGYHQRWEYVVGVLVAWSFLAVVLKMTVGLLLQWIGRPPSSWWSRLREARHPHRRSVGAPGPPSVPPHA